MSRKRRIILLIIAGLLALAGLALLLATLAPGETVHLQATLAPTLLAPPGGLP